MTYALQLRQQGKACSAIVVVALPLAGGPLPLISGVRQLVLLVEGVLCLGLVQVPSTVLLALLLPCPAVPTF